MNAVFQIGDKVRCINAHRSLINGKIYTVETAEDSPFGGISPLISVEGLSPTRFYSSRFTLLTRSGKRDPKTRAKHKLGVPKGKLP